MADFYYISPKDVHYLRAGSINRVNLEAVIRIAMSTWSVFEFLEKCKEIVPPLEEKYQQAEAINI